MNGRVAGHEHDEGRVREVADVLVWLLGRRQPTLGGGRLLCLDGRAGAGKTTLAAAVATAGAALGTVAVVHVDDLLEGWGGLPASGARVERLVLRPLATGRPGRYGRWDWHADAWAEEPVTVAPVDLLVLEGVGAGRSSYADLVTLLVWVDVPAELARRRGLARDGTGMAEHWEQWVADEAALLARERPEDRADVVVDGTGDAEAAVVVR